MVAGLVKLSKLVSWLAQKNKELFSEHNLERNSSLREWQKLYLEQDAVFLSGEYKKARGEQKAKGKKPASLIIKQKYVIS